MAYVKNDKDCNPVDPQPVGIGVNHFSGNEGWATVTYKNWNNDYVARNPDNSARTPGTFQARNTDNTTRTPGVYQRHGVTNSAIEA